MMIGIAHDGVVIVRHYLFVKRAQMDNVDQLALNIFGLQVLYFLL